ncbi:hypothetical protein M011DRAFT_462660 [Sporormia fimetaria CBS 119925]|uniref:Uncharacterized protein n=1 Tax=Sporormia fimetaria CBS 119925 TaxID=1340428 RepID=A0A6A6UYY9_9PLEO|nr:hypothetical protein M011DRAFT_462660 [Sporormia fimetaria CBS 119925]
MSFKEIEQKAAAEMAEETRVAWSSFRQRLPEHRSLCNTVLDQQKRTYDQITTEGHQRTSTEREKLWRDACFAAADLRVRHRCLVEEIEAKLDKGKFVDLYLFYEIGNRDEKWAAPAAEKARRDLEKRISDAEVILKEVNKEDEKLKARREPSWVAFKDFS